MQPVYADLVRTHPDGLEIRHRLDGALLVLKAFRGEREVGGACFSVRDFVVPGGFYGGKLRPEKRVRDLHPCGVVAFERRAGVATRLYERAGELYPGFPIGAAAKGCRTDDGRRFRQTFNRTHPQLCPRNSSESSEADVSFSP